MTGTESTSAAYARVLAERDAIQAELLRVLDQACWACVRCGRHNRGSACVHCGQALVPAEEQLPT